MSETPESSPSALVVSSPKALAIASRQLHIAGQALARVGQDRYIEFFATHPQASRAFVVAVSQWYPCSESMIDRYADLWKWEALSGNKTLPWNEKLIERYADRWDWEQLCSQKALPWSEQLVEWYEDRVHWWELLNNDAVPWTEDMVSRYRERWDIRVFSCAEALPWSDALIASYSEMWAWEQLSTNKALPWSCELIDLYSEFWDWEGISENPSLPWSIPLIERYADRWDWYFIGGNDALPWSESLIARYSERWDESLSSNEALPWTESLLSQYADIWDWGRLSSNNALPWTVELVDLYIERWDWQGISGNAALPWSEALINRYAVRWDWNWLSCNDGLPWSEALIESYADRWDWERLSGNHALPWSEELIKRYADRWVWQHLPQVALSKILLCWPETSICAVMDRMLHGPKSRGDSIRACCAAASVDHAETALHHQSPAQPAGIDPEMLADGIYLVGFHVEAGVRKFAALAQAMVDDLGSSIESLRPYLPSWYNGARDALEGAGQDVSDMDDPAAVRAQMSEWAKAVSEPTAQQPAADQATLTPEQPPTGAPDDNRSLGSDGQKTLEAVATPEVGGPEGSGPTGAGDQSGGATSDGRKGAADEGRLPGARGGRGSASGVHPAAAGAGPRLGRGAGRKPGGKTSRGVRGTAADGALAETDPPLTPEDIGTARVNGVLVAPPAIPARNFQITEAVALGEGGQDIYAMVRALVRALVKDHGMERATVERMAPYITRFAEDVAAGVIPLGEIDVQRAGEDTTEDRGPNGTPGQNYSRPAVAPGTFGSDPAFNEDTYAKAKPHFIAMAEHLKGAR